MKRYLPAVVLLGFLPLTAACARTSSNAELQRGLAFYNEGRYESALSAFDAAVARSPRDPAAYNNRAVARVRLGQLVGAIGDYTKAIELAPTDPELYFNRGDAYVALGNYDYAIQDFNHAIALAPGYGRAYFNRGTARLRAGDRDGAMADWRYAISLEKDPWVQAAMVRSAGLGSPAVRGPVSSMPGVLTPSSATAAAAAPPPPEVSASPALDNRPTGTPQTGPPSLDARALAERGLSREIDGDHAGAVSDLRAALGMETNPERRSNIERLLRTLEMPR